MIGPRFIFLRRVRSSGGGIENRARRNHIGSDTSPGHPVRGTVQFVIRVSHSWDPECYLARATYALVGRLHGRFRFRARNGFDGDSTAVRHGRAFLGFADARRRSMALQLEAFPTHWRGATRRGAAPRRRTSANVCSELPRIGYEAQRSAICRPHAYIIFHVAPLFVARATPAAYKQPAALQSGPQ